MILGGGNRQKYNLNASETEKQVKNETVSRGNVFWNLNSERKKKFRKYYLFFSIILWNAYCYPKFFDEEMVAKTEYVSCPRPYY